MTGQSLYQIQREVSAAFNERLPPWEELSETLRAQWEMKAYEQSLRDRAPAATLREAQRKDVPYDGHYAD